MEDSYFRITNQLSKSELQAVKTELANNTAAIRSDVDNSGTHGAGALVMLGRRDYIANKSGETRDRGRQPVGEMS